MGGACSDKGRLSILRRISEAWRGPDAVFNIGAIY